MKRLQQTNTSSQLPRTRASRRHARPRCSPWCTLPGGRGGADRLGRLLLAAPSAGERSGTSSGFTHSPLTLRPVLACSTANGGLPYGRTARDAALARIARWPKCALLLLALKDPHASRQQRKDQYDATCRPDHLSQHHHVTCLSCRSIALRSRRWASSSVSSFRGSLAREQAARRSSAAWASARASRWLSTTVTVGSPAFVAAAGSFRACDLTATAM